MAKYSQIQVCLNNTCTGDGVLTDVTKTGFVGNARATINCYELGKFKVNWQGLYDKFKAYINAETFNIVYLNTLEWTLYGSEIIVAPKFYNQVTNVTPKTITMVEGKIIAHVPDNIFLTITNVLYYSSDVERLFTDYTPEEILLEILKYIPNTIRDGKIILYYSEINDNSVYNFNNGEVIDIVYSEGDYYANLVDELISTQGSGGINGDTAAYKIDNGVLNNGRHMLTPDGAPYLYSLWD